MLDQIEELRRKEAPGHSRLPPEKVAYARGNIQFRYDDLDGALENMKKAAANAHNLDLNSGALAWMRLGQIHDLKGDRPSAVGAYRRAAAFAPNSEAARESRSYVASPYRRRRKG